MSSFRRALATLGVAACLVASSVVAVACSSSSSAGAAFPDGGGTSDAAPEDGSSPTDGGAADATDGGASACEGTCKTTALVADFGGKKRTLVRGQFGTQQGADGGAELHTESHLGGQSGCPTQQSPSPDYTLIVTAVPRGATGKKLSERDGLTSAFFDFKGDLGLAAPSGITKAIALNVTVVGEDPATPPSWVALDVVASFTEGEVRGHLFAEYCDSLSQ
jgi:hypothetical protein